MEKELDNMSSVLNAKTGAINQLEENQHGMAQKEAELSSRVDSLTRELEEKET